MFAEVRQVIAGLIVLGLAVGVYLAWPKDAEGPADPEATPKTSTTTTLLATTTTTADDATSTTTVDSHVVTTVEEAEAILRELWFGWFEGIYNQDEDRIREVVVLESQVEAAAQQFGVMEFEHDPAEGQLVLSEIELMRSDDGCLAIWATVEASFRSGQLSSLVVFRRIEGSWKMLTSWTHKDDLWEADCDAAL